MLARARARRRPSRKVRQDHAGLPGRRVRPGQRVLLGQPVLLGRQARKAKPARKANRVRPARTAKTAKASPLRRFPPVKTGVWKVARSSRSVKAKRPRVTAKKAKPRQAVA